MARRGERRRTRRDGAPPQVALGMADAGLVAAMLSPPDRGVMRRVQEAQDEAAETVLGNCGAPGLSALAHLNMAAETLAVALNALPPEDWPVALASCGEVALTVARTFQAERAAGLGGGEPPEDFPTAGSA